VNIANIGVGVYTDLAKFSSGLRDAQSAAFAFAGAAATAFGSVATAAFAAGLAIDDAMDGIRISTGATGEALAGLEGSFNRVFASVPSSAAEASTAVSQLSVRTGATGVALENLSTQVLTLSRITKSDLNATVADSAKVFQGWGIAAREQAGTLDMVLRASQRTGVTVGALLQTMVTAGPVFRAAGFDLATSAALIGGFEKAGVNGQRAVASFTAAFRFFAKEGIDAGRGIKDTIARIQELGPGAQASALGVKVFGRSAVDMVAAIHSGRLDVDALAQSIATGSETIATAAKATDGFTETLAQLRNNAVLALEPFGTAILGTFNTALAGILAPSRALLGTLNLLAQAAIALSIAMGTKLVVGFVAATRAKIADLIAGQAARVAAVQHTAAVAAQAQAQFVAATAALNAARAETALTGSLVAQRAALVAVSTAHAQAAAAASAHAAAIQAASLSARVGAASMNILKGALAFFGGPIGLAITAVLTVVGFAFFNAGRRAREAAADARKAAEEFRSAIATMDDASFEAAATVTRQNYRRTRELIAQQEASITRAEALLEAARKADRPASAFAEGRGIAPEASAATRAAEAALRRERENLDRLNRSRQRYADGVIAVREQEAALARQRAAMPEIPGGPAGPVDWEGSGQEAQRASQSLRERASVLAEIFHTQREQGRDTAALYTELNRIWEQSTDALRAMGDATRLDQTALKDYQTWLGIVRELQSANIAGPAAVRQAPAAAAASVTVLPLLNTAERFARIVKDSAADFGSTITGKMEQASGRFKSAAIEGSQAAAERLQAAGEKVRNMWSGLLANMPQQLADFVGMFNAIKEKHVAQRKAGEAVTGMAAFPGAIAFMLAAEAIAPILDALREPFTALLIPVQMAAAAFGPLLTSLIKALFPIFKQFGVAITYVAQVAGYVGGALLKVVGEIIRTVGSLIAKIPGLGQEGAAIKNFGKGLTDASKEMFEMARAMPGVREELRNLDWDEAMKRAADSANRLADSLTNVPEVFDLIARRTQAMRATVPSAAGYSRVDVTSAPAPSPSTQQYVQGGDTTNNTFNVTFSPTINGGGDLRQIEALLRKERDRLVSDLRMPGTSPIKAAVRTATTSPY
jgi:phage-related minor tail protein